MKVDKNPRIDKQPLWVQDYVRRLEYERDVAVTENQQFRRGHFGEIGSNTRVTRFGEDPGYLPHHAHIELQTDPEDEHSIIRVRVTRKGTININGQGQLMILPNASNE